MNKCRHIFSSLQVAAIILAFAALSIPAAEAGVEFVAPIGSCSNHVDTIGDGKDLFIIQGPNIQFEVFGNSVDLSNPSSGFRIATDSGTGTATARIIRQHSGPENFTRGCGNTGSAEVEVDSDINLTSDIQRSLFFKMPAGDESRLQMRIKAYPTFTAVYTVTDMGCIVKTGTLEKVNQDKKIKITLPAGHRQDNSSCNQHTISARIDPVDIGELDIPGPNFSYSVSGRPSFVTVSQTPSSGSLVVHPGLSFNFDVAGIRALTTTSNSHMTVASKNPNRNVVLDLEVVPELGNGFSAAASCNPGTLVAGNLTDCSITLAKAPIKVAQPITWRMTTANCFTQANTSAPYNPNASFQVFDFPAGQTTAIIRVRSVNNGGCTQSQATTTHIFEGWVGDFRVDPQVTTPTSGPKYTKTIIKLNSPN
jgi:hypothetical protein